MPHRFGSEFARIISTVRSVSRDPSDVNAEPATTKHFRYAADEVSHSPAAPRPKGVGRHYTGLSHEQKTASQSRFPRDGDCVGVSILGLKFLGLPVLEAPRAGIEHRLYGINRNSRALEDLEIGHCMFLGDYVTNPIHVGIIANGNGIDIHHTIFRENKITVVYWQGGSRGHAMRNCIITGCYGSGLWTAGIASDFRFENNVVDDCRYVWTYQNAAPAPRFLYNPDGSMSDIPFGGGAAADAAAEASGRGTAAGGGRGGAAAGRGPGPGGGRGPIPANELVRYKVVNCHIGKNLNLAGSGTGATLGYVPIDAAFLELVGRPDRGSSPREAKEWREPTGLRRFSNEPAAEIVQCEEPARKPNMFHICGYAGSPVV